MRTSGVGLILTSQLLKAVTCKFGHLHFVSALLLGVVECIHNMMYHECKTQHYPTASVAVGEPADGPSGDSSQPPKLIAQRVRDTCVKPTPCMSEMKRASSET